jgi:hypothetical protein
MINKEGFDVEGPIEKEALVSELKELLMAAYNSDEVLDSYSNHEFIVKKASELRIKYSDFNDYEMYHVLIGSSKECTKFDFPGDNSVEKFLRSL